MSRIIFIIATKTRRHEVFFYAFLRVFVSSWQNCHLILLKYLRLYERVVITIWLYLKINMFSKDHGVKFSQIISWQDQNPGLQRIIVVLRIWKYEVLKNRQIRMGSWSLDSCRFEAQILSISGGGVAVICTIFHNST